MSVRVQPVSVLSWSNSTLFLMSRSLGNDGSLIQQADISSISYTVEKDGEIVAGPTPLVVADVIFDTLQTDARWDIDSTGYNFAFELPPSVIPDDGEIHIIRVDASPASGAAFCVGVWRVETRDESSGCP